MSLETSVSAKSKISILPRKKSVSIAFAQKFHYLCGKLPTNHFKRYYYEQTC